MYNDILMSGSRRFVTTMVNSDSPNDLAEVGVVLYLEDLKEVSQQTNDAVKYVCSHKVLDKRVNIHAARLRGVPPGPSCLPSFLGCSSAVPGERGAAFPRPEFFGARGPPGAVPSRADVGPSGRC